MSEPEIIPLDEQAAETSIRCASAVQKVTIVFADGTQISTVMGPGQEILLEYGSGPRPIIRIDDAGTQLGNVKSVEPT